jgi:two-component sensor histidine kinase
LVSSLFGLQAAAADDPRVAQSLQEAMGRVGAVARIHERLYQSPDVATVDLAAYLRDICTDLTALAPQCQIVFRAEGAVPMGPDRAVRVALLTTELVTNAAKHAGAGQIVVRLAVPEATPPSLTLTVRDEGPGLPDGFNVGGAQTLGVKIIRALVEQMGASLTAKSAHPGAEIVVDIPKSQL